MERYIAVDNVCAWPNLTRLPDGDIVAHIFNQPTHLRWPGDVECWASADEGRTWTKRGTVTAHEPDTARGNVAAGLAHDGALIVLVSGWSFQGPNVVVGQNNERGKVLPPWVMRSTDGGRTWQRAGTVNVPDSLPAAMVPFGDIERSPDGTLGVSMYTGGATAFFFRSRDDGHTWGDPVAISSGQYNETDLLCLDERRWLAASRTQRDNDRNQSLDLFASDDGGRTWQPRGPLTLPMQHPAHLLRLADGRILLTYGIRNRGLWGVGARLSLNDGQTWHPPIVLVNLGAERRDCGYPSSVQAPDGTIVTAYYASGTDTHHRYHMGVVRWQADEA